LFVGWILSYPIFLLRGENASLSRENCFKPSLSFTIDKNAEVGRTAANGTQFLHYAGGCIVGFGMKGEGHPINRLKSIMLNNS
jgi:hypothetical protein